MNEDCPECGGDGICTSCGDDGGRCVWCDDGACTECDGYGTVFRCEEV